MVQLLGEKVPPVHVQPGTCQYLFIQARLDGDGRLPRHGPLDGEQLRAQRLGRKPAARIPVFLRVLCAERRPVSLKVIPDHRMHLRFRVQHTPPRANCQCGFRADLCFSRVKREKGGKYPGFFCISMIRTARRCAAAADRQKSAWFRAKMRKIFKNHLDKPCTACYNIERRFEWIGYSSLAQSVERVTVNHDVVGSSPTGGAKEKTTRFGWFFLWLLVRRA